MSPLVLFDSSSSTGAGCHGADVAEASSVCLSPDCSAPGSSRDSSPGRGTTTISSSILTRPSMVFGPGRPPRRLSMGDSTEVVETILQSRAPTTRKSYAAKW